MVHAGEEPRRGIGYFVAILFVLTTPLCSFLVHYFKNEQPFKTRGHFFIQVNLISSVIFVLIPIEEITGIYHCIARLLLATFIVPFTFASFLGQLHRTVLVLEKEKIKTKLDDKNAKDTDSEYQHKDDDKMELLESRTRQLSTSLALKVLIICFIPFGINFIAQVLSNPMWINGSGEKCSEINRSTAIVVMLNAIAYGCVLIKYIRKLIKLDSNAYGMRAQSMRSVFLYGWILILAYLILSTQRNVQLNVFPAGYLLLVFRYLWWIDSILIPAYPLIKRRFSNNYQSLNDKLRTYSTANQYLNNSYNLPTSQANGWGQDNLKYFYPAVNEDLTHPKTLQALLATDLGVSAFREHLALELSQENLLCYNALKIYMTSKDKPSIEMAERIYQRFISFDAPLQVNLSADVVHSVENKLKKLEVLESTSQGCDPENLENLLNEEEAIMKDIFEGALTEVQMLLSLDTLSRFLTTGLYRKLCTELEEEKANAAKKENRRSLNFGGSVAGGTKKNKGDAVDDDGSSSAHSYSVASPRSAGTMSPKKDKKSDVKRQTVELQDISMITSAVDDQVNTPITNKNPPSDFGDGDSISVTSKDYSETKVQSDDNHPE